jgi:hypothetical protein
LHPDIEGISLRQEKAMSLWTQLPDLLVSAMVFTAAIAAFFLFGLQDDDDESHTWGEDPHVVALLCGMSL